MYIAARFPFVYCLSVPVFFHLLLSYHFIDGLFVFAR